MILLKHIPTSSPADLHAAELLQLAGGIRHASREQAVEGLQRAWEYVRVKYELDCCSPRIDLCETFAAKEIAS
jgi:hypothetical protein